MFDTDHAPITDMDYLSFAEDSMLFDSSMSIDDSLTIGDPFLLECEFQCEPDNCAVEAERSIINMFVDTPLDQQQAMHISSSHGWYQPGVGTSPADIGQMMDLYDIPNHTVVNASVADLAQELAQGHGVIVGVDSNELWDQGPLADLKQWLSTNTGADFGDESANHAVVVTGIDVSDPGNPMVIINDSGIPNGQGVAYPMEKFLQCWEDSNCYYTATDIPLPSGAVHGSMTDMNTALSNMSLGCSIGDLVGSFVAGYSGAAEYNESGNLISAMEHGYHNAVSTARLLDDIFGEEGIIATL